MLFEDAESGILVLLDPDKLPRKQVAHVVERVSGYKRVRAILVGTSLLMSTDFVEFTKMVKDAADVPVVLFPGGVHQVSPYADAILFLSVISGRNPELLIGEQVRMAPFVRKYGLEVIPTAYMLVESGNIPSVEFITHTMPIPRDKTDIAVAHAMAAEMLGFKLIYLEAGSGAKYPVPPEMIRAVHNAVDIPVIVGGGLRDPNAIELAFEAGAKHVVIGTAIEEDQNFLEVIDR